MKLYPVNTGTYLDRPWLVCGSIRKYVSLIAKIKCRINSTVCFENKTRSATKHAKITDIYVMS